MELRKNDRVFFEPNSHQYILDGEKFLIGVTTLLAKHHLAQDVSGIPQNILDEAARKGTSIHEEIEAYDRGDAVVLTPLLKEYRKLHLKHIASEFLVSDNDIVASSIDGVYKGKRKNGVIIVDYKTTYDKHIRPWGWQTSIYKYLLEKQCTGIEVEGLYVLWIDKNERTIKEFIEIDPIPEAMVDELFECERKGEIYTDPASEVRDISVVLSESEVAQYISSIDTLAELNAKMKDAEKIVDKANEKVLEFMVANGLEELSAEGGSFKVKNGYVRQGFDAKTFRAEHPKLAKKYDTLTPVRASLMFKRNKTK